MGRIGLSIRHQGTIYPAWSQDSGSIADAFDAIRIPEVSNPVARNKIALRIIQVAAGTQFDPELVKALRLFQEYMPDPDLVEPTMRNCFDSH